jgi:FkbH-like protein
MKILCISDVTIDPFIRVIEKSVPEWKFNLNFSENLALQLSNIEIENDVDLIYIHIDSYFKKYEASYVNSLIENIFTFASKTTKTVVCSNLICESYKASALSYSLGNIIDSSLSFIEFYRKINHKLKNLYFFDMWDLILNLGINNVYNYRLGHLYQMPYNKTFLINFESKWVDFIQKLIEPDKKVIVLDCDNTLWKGIVGEDGIDGIKCDLNEDGILYYHFHQFLIQKKSEGFLLALCSKNNEEDVKDAFSGKKMPLTWNDFVVKKVNWTDKQININEIAKELNLGIESLIFIDDSDFEVNSIKTIFPKVHVIKISNDYNSLIQIFNDFKLKKKTITNEDLNKTGQYIQESLRDQIKNNSDSFDDYIKSLEINIHLDINSEKDFERISQLTEKTNQFNFNKKKYEVAELIDFVHKGEMKIFSIKVNDKYGDYGLVGVIFITFDYNSPVLENYIMSCRALGRRIEYDFLGLVENNLIKENGVSFKQIKFEKTEKNSPAEKFYIEINDKYGFR